MDSPASDWRACGHKFPRSEVVFVTQTLILYVVVITSLVNLTIGNEQNTLWTALLSSCLGYMLPNPSIKKSQQMLPAGTFIS